jgi:peroxiredoxin
MRRLAWLALSALALAGAAPRAAAAQDVGLAIGSHAPAIQIGDLDGNPVDLAQYIGRKPVLMEFWAHWCTVCAALEPRLRASEQHYGSDVAFLTVAVGVNQTARSIRRHLEDHAVPGRLLFDRDGRATRAYDAPSTSYIVILDRHGRVAYTGVGEDQNLAAALARVTAAR